MGKLMSWRNLALSGLLVFGLSGCDPQYMVERAQASAGAQGLLGSNVPEARIAYHSAALKRNPSDVTALKGLGGEYALLSRWQDSAGAYREALILRPRDSAALVGYGEALLAMGDSTGAMSAAEDALAVERSLPALMLAGTAKNYSGDIGGGLELFEEALAGNPRDLDLRNNIALSMALQGDQAALPMMEAVAFAPDSDGRHKRNLVLITTLLGQGERAAARGKEFAIPASEIKEIQAVARKMRTQGAQAAGLATAT